MDSFAARKHQVVSSLVEALDSERRDKSPKGFIDAPVLDLIHIINRHPNYYTTSSCSGRVAVYCEGVQGDKSTTKGGIWLFVTHDPVTFPDDANDDWVTQLLFGSDRRVFRNNSAAAKDILDKQMIYFKFESLILHVESASIEASMRLNSLAFQAGYQNSGITPSKNREMLAIRSTHKIDTPIGYVDANGDIQCLVDPTYLLLLLHMSNVKFTQNTERMKLFEEMMEKEVQGSTTRIETKEERRERKRREGMEKQKTTAKSSSAVDIDLADLSLEEH